MLLKSLARSVEAAQAMAYRILVVEDEIDTRELLAVTLGLDGHHVETAEDGRKALELLAGRSYDVILSNLRMPGMTGEDLYRRVEHGWPHLAPRFVFVTGEKPGGFQTRYGGRSVPVVTKPYSPERLRQVIEEVVARDV
jgi:CheY-like chemotaxis protein